MTNVLILPLLQIKKKKQTISIVKINVFFSLIFLVRPLLKNNNKIKEKPNLFSESLVVW